MARRGRKSKHSVQLGWKEIRKSCSWFFWKFLSYFSYLRWALSVFQLLTRFFRWPSRTYTLDGDGSIAYRPSIWERLATNFRSEAANRRRLLEWAQKHLPKGFKANNYTTCWSDGITLCALLETLCPGACPRYDLLKPNHKANNCRLGLKLAQKHFGIPQTIITPEEMSLSAAQSEAKMRQLLSLIKWASIQRHDVKEEEKKTTPGPMEILHMPKILGKRATPCTVRGSGLLVGIVGKRCKFDLFPPVSEHLDILVEVRGPNSMYCSERITSLFPKSRRNSSASIEPPLLSAADTPKPPLKNGTANHLGDDLAGKEDSSHRQSTQPARPAELGEESMKIPFDYKCVGEGQIQINYVPRSSGQHLVSVKWQNKHIRGSPFSAIVAETLEKLNEECKGIGVRHKKVTFDKGEIVVNKSDPDNSGLSDVAVTLEKPSPTSEEAPDLPSGVTAAVRSRSSKVHRSISKSGLVTSQKLTTQTTITRRRVLKRIITTGGQEIVIHETSETPIASREGSRDSTSSMADSIASGERRRSVTSRNQSTTKSFDCEITYDADDRVATSTNNISQKAPIDQLLRRVATETFVHGVLERVVDNVMKQVHMNNIKRHAEENMKLRRGGSKHKLHPRLGARMSLPLQGTPGNNLGLPSFDVKFQCSPYTETKELPVPVREKEKVKDKLSLPSDLLSIDDAKDAGGHKKLCATKSAPMSKLPKVKDKEQNKKNFNKWINSWIDAHCQPGGPPEKFIENPKLISELIASHEDSQSQLAKESEVKEERLQMPTLQEVHSEEQADSGISSATVHTDRERDREELTRSETETSTESARVTVRTQLKEKKHRPTEFDLDRHKKELNPTFGKACIMDMEPMSPSPQEHALSKRSMTLPVSPITIDDETYPNAPASPMKVLHSDRVNQSCYYISQHAVIVNSSSSQSSGAADLSVDSQTSADYNPTTGRHPPMLKQTMSKIQLRMSSSLPTLSRNWTAFELDDETLSIEEMEALSCAAQKGRKRMTLGESELSEGLREGIENKDGRQSLKIYSDMRSLRESTVSKRDRLGDTGLHVPPLPSPSMSMDLNTPQHASPNVSPFSSPDLSRVNSRRNSISRPEVVALQKVSEEMNSLEEALSNLQPLPDISPKTTTHDLLHRSQDMKMTTMTSRSFMKVNSGSPNQFSVSIKIPKATIDRWTQVNYEEIKEATGWVRPTTYVRPRPRIVRNEAIQGSSMEIPAGPNNSASNQNSAINGGNIPTIVCQRDDQNDAPRAVPAVGVRNMLSPEGGERLEPRRQSTVDTVDSGIADDNGSPKTSDPPPPRRVLRAPTIPSIPAHPPKPRFISGHRAVTRSRYRGKITLDPKLVGGHGSPSTTTSSTEDSMHRRKGLHVMRYTRSNSDARKGKRRLPSREESASDNENRGLRKRQSYRGGCFKRRVTFSRRVLMYRRSTSRNSSRNSRSRDDTTRSSAQTDPLLEVSENQADNNNIGGGKPDSHRTKGKNKPKLRRKAPAETKWLSQLSKESRESMESSSTSSKRSFNIDSPQPCVKHTESLPGPATQQGKGKLAHRRSASTDLVSDFFYATEIGSDEDDESKREKEENSVDDFDGFGLTSAGRKSLIEELESFHKLSSAGQAESGAANRAQYAGSSAESSMEELAKFHGPRTASNPANMGVKPDCQTPDIVIHSEESPFSRVILKGDDCMPYRNPPPSKQQDTPRSPQRPIASLIDSFEAEVADLAGKGHIRGEIVEMIKGNSSPEHFTFDLTPGLPDPFKCRAFGCALKLGHVGVKNNFQVCAKTSGNGALSVAISGPRPRTVSETSLTYTGDDLYEVLYEVSQPGIYLINIKWNEYQIQDSPFVCQVTY